MFQVIYFHICDTTWPETDFLCHFIDFNILLFPTFIFQVFGQGTGFECRQHVQRLNLAQAEKDNHVIEQYREWENHELDDFHQGEKLHHLSQEKKRLNYVPPLAFWLQSIGQKKTLLQLQYSTGFFGGQK